MGPSVGWLYARGRAMTPSPPLPRLLPSVDLSLPLRDLEAALLGWGCRQAEGAVFSIDQLRDLRPRVEARSASPRDRHLAMDIHLALGAYEARLREPVGGWPAYIEAWEEQRVNRNLGLCTELDQL